MTVIDPEFLTWDNIARHELGGRYVNVSKATALAAVLRGDFPHLAVRGYTQRWEAVWNSATDIFIGADLIISTVADWRSEAHLNAILRTEASFPPVLFAWLEDRAAAAQALIVAGEGGCLACGMDRWGAFSERVIHFEKRSERRVPGCDAFYQPYSALDAEQGAAIVTEAALDALRERPLHSRLVTWIGARKVLAEHGGELRAEWQENHPNAIERTRFEQSWGRSAICGYCA
jgi:hypothetical protein